uniref:Coatomer subunit delta n=1 Tax=Heliothis virescens TaxID=7102 RepID=A0A2A4JU45_HELVI
MVLIAATVCTKSGKALVSRQFVEMTKARIEGLLAAFPKLMTGGRQHTFVETESVRYVYQPLDKLYMLLITTKASNILEDLETLRLFSRVVPEYCTQLTEAEVLNQAFNLLFAFDEIVALGYRESVNLAQVRSFVEMDSHEEKIYQAVRQTQEREAANRMRERAKELQRERLEAAKRGAPTRSQMAFGSSFSSSSMSSSAVSEPIAEKIPTTPARETARPAGRSAMKLGSRGTDAESFVSRLRSEGEAVAAPAPLRQDAPKLPPTDHKEVHLRFEERLTLVAGRDGDVQNFELSGLLTLRISNEQYARIHVHVDNQDTRPLQLQEAVSAAHQCLRLRARPAGRSAMKLGSRGTDAESFVSRLRSEGEAVAAPAPLRQDAPKLPPTDHKEVHLRFEERLTLVAGRDGDVQNFELSGLLTLRISNEQYARIHVHVDNQDTRPLQLQTHPNVDKEAFRSQGVIGLKQSQRAFPLNSDVGVLKWRLNASDDKLAPLSVNCWPSEGAGGGCDVNIEYELEHEHLTLTDVNIHIPLPSGNIQVVVHQWEGSYTQKGRVLLWTIPIINKQQKSASLEFTVTPAVPNDFFPLTVTWTSDTSLALLKATKVTHAEDSSPVDYSQEISFHPDKYEIV